MANERIRTQCRVLHVVNHLCRGGGFDCAVDFIQEANRIPGQEHGLLALRTDNREQAVIPPGLPLLHGDAGTMESLVRKIREGGYDFLQWHWWRDNPEMGRMMELLAAVEGPGRIVTCDVYPSAPEYALGAREIGYADWIVFDGLDAMKAYRDIPGNRKLHIVGGAALSQYQQASKRRADGSFRIGRGSVLSPWKCPPDLIEMVAPALRAIPNAEFHIFGDGELRSKLECDLRNLGLADRILMRGWVRNFVEEIALLDAYLYHCPRLSFGSSELTLQGAMAAGVPVVVLPSMGVRWMFEHGRNALVAENAAEAAEYCVKLACDPELRARIGSAGQDKAVREFGVANAVRQYIEHVYSAFPPVRESGTRADPSANRISLPDRQESLPQQTGHAQRRLKGIVRRARLRVRNYLLDSAARILLSMGRRVGNAYTHSFAQLNQEWYDHRFDHLRGPENWVWIKRGIETSRFVLPGDRVLDLCCGDGTFTRYFYGAVAGLVVGVDRNAAAIRQARRRWNPDHVRFCVADVVRDPWPLPEWDVIVLNAALEYFSESDMRLLLSRVAGALAPGRGVLLGCTIIRPSSKLTLTGQKVAMESDEQLDRFLRQWFRGVEVWRVRQKVGEMCYFRCFSQIH